MTPSPTTLPAPRPSIALPIAMTGITAVLFGCAALSRSSNPDVAYPRWVERTRTALVAQGDAASLFAAGLLIQNSLPGVTRSDEEVVALQQRAALAAPDSVVLATSRIATCLYVVACDGSAAAATLRALDPANAASIMPTLAAALKMQDGALVDQTLAQLAEIPRFDTYHNPAVMLATEAFARTRLPARPESRRPGREADWTITAISGLVHQSAALYNSIPKACRDSEAGSLRRTHCVSICRRMVQSDTNVVQAMGASLLGRYGEPGSVDAALAQSWRRNFDWTGEQILKGYQTRKLKAVRAAFEQAMRQNPREADAIRAVLETLKLEAEPPPGWSRPKREPKL